MKHFARKTDFLSLYAYLQREVKDGNIYEVRQGDRSLFCYTNRCVYERLWNDWNLIARGLILDLACQQVLATPFPKFFNYGELSQSIPNEPFEAYEKLDGSLGIAYYYQGSWHIATKGSFDSTQAIWGTEQLRALDLSHLESGATYLFELVYPENKIVVKYSFKGLILLAAYDSNGYELNYNQLTSLAEKLGVNIVQKIDIDSVENILEISSNLDKNSEGFVLRFESAFRVKIKGSEYSRIHQLISGITPLGIWECMKNDDNLLLFRQEIPEEYWQNFDEIYYLLLDQFHKLVDEVELWHQKFIDLSDKELGLILTTLPDLAKKFIFARRKDGQEWHRSVKFKEKLYSLIRPTDNQIRG